MSVEIHTRIMPRFWKLPEKDMLERACSLKAFPGLSVLDTEGMLLHALVHSSAHLYSRGLRAGWDVAWLSQLSSDIDWDRVLGWARSCAMPAAFFVPATVMARGLGLPALENVVEARPAGKREKARERVASARLFTARESAFELNPVARNAFYLLLHDRWRDRFAYLRAVTGRDERESRRSSARRRQQNAGLARTKSVFSEALGHFRAYRRTAMEDARRQASAEALRAFPD